MAERIFNVLFLCSGNSARSILAESILRKEGAGLFRAFSAGSHPKPAVHPLSLKVLEAHGYPTDGLRAKSWNEFAAPGAPHQDFVFTVCDTAAAETCPIWPGQPMTAHWGIEDPAAVEGTDIQKEAAFVLAARYLKNRISIFVNLPIRSLDRLSLTAKLREIGTLEGANKAEAGGRMMDVIIYHNPACGTSRNVLAMIRNSGVEPHIIEYLRCPPTRLLLIQLLDRAGITVRQILREKGTPYHELGLGNPSLSDDVLLDAIDAHPILINRPLVVTPKGVGLCRPSETVLDLLPPQRGQLIKENGERVVDDVGRPVASA
jgi:arsenate reductase (thioredoxin)